MRRQLQDIRVTFLASDVLILISTHIAERTLNKEKFIDFLGGKIKAMLRYVEKIVNP